MKRIIRNLRQTKLLESQKKLPFFQTEEDDSSQVNASIVCPALLQVQCKNGPLQAQGARTQWEHNLLAHQRVHRDVSEARRAQTYEPGRVARLRGWLGARRAFEAAARRRLSNPPVKFGPILKPKQQKHFH